MCSAACTVVGPEIVCNDDSCGVGPQVAFAAIEGQSYLIHIGGAAQTAIGTRSLTLRIAAGGEESEAVITNDISTFLSAWLASIGVPCP